MPHSDTNIASAARRVAAKLAPHHGKDLTGQCLILDAPDALALLPVLDAVAAGQDDEGRVERWARLLCRQHLLSIGASNPNGGQWEDMIPDARAAMALADAERVAAVAEGWGNYERAADDYCGALRRMGQNDEESDDSEVIDSRTTLDAAVRRLAGVGSVASSGDL